MSRITLILCVVEGAAALVLGGMLIFSGSDPATAGLDRLSGIVLIMIAAAFVGPGAWLAWQGRRPRLALFLALAPVAILALLLSALVLSMD